MNNIPADVRVCVSITNCGDREKATLITPQPADYRERRETDRFEGISVADVEIQGYLVARCFFSPARGFAVLCGLGKKDLSTGYLAEVIDVGDNRIPRERNPMGTRRVGELEID